MKRVQKSVLIPLFLLVYLAVMAFIGRHNLVEGNYWEYFGIIAISLVCIAGLYYTLRTQEKIRARRQQELEELERKSREESESTAGKEERQ